MPEARNATRWASSLGSPRRPTAVSAARWASASSSVMPSCLARAVTFDSIRSLMIEPGHTLLTRMPSRPTSSARVLAKATTPRRVTPESTRLGMGWYTVLARILMIRPAACCLRWGSASRHIRAKKNSDRSTAVAHCSSLAVWAWASGGPEAADGLGPVQVAREHQHVAPGRAPDVLRGLLQIVPRPAADRDVAAFLGQYLRAGPPEALAGAADDRDLVPELEIHGACYPTKGCDTLRPPAGQLRLTFSAMRCDDAAEQDQ